jgi:uncharacterized protein YjiS (DUF1127 family)
MLRSQNRPADYAARLRRRYRRRWWVALLRALLRRLRSGQGAAELRGLDDHGLADLGLSRSGIDAAARGLFR